MTTELCKIAQTYNVDKCPKLISKYVTHSYTPEYHLILNSLRGTATSILEIGVGNIPLMDPILYDYIPGASLRMWREYFPKANIYSCDTVKEVLFSEDRIKCFECDQNSVSSLLNLYDQIRLSGCEKQFDIIIDDGSHQKEHQITSFVTLWNFLKPSGIYIIEDAFEGNLDYFADLPNKLGFKNAEVIKIHRGTWNGDNFIAFYKTS